MVVDGLGGLEFPSLPAVHTLDIHGAISLELVLFPFRLFPMTLPRMWPLEVEWMPSNGAISEQDVRFL